MWDTQSSCDSGGGGAAGVGVVMSARVAASARSCKCRNPKRRSETAATSMARMSIARCYGHGGSQVSLPHFGPGTSFCSPWRQPWVRVRKKICQPRQGRRPRFSSCRPRRSILRGRRRMSPRPGLPCPDARALSHGWLAVGYNDSARFAGFEVVFGLRLTALVHTKRKPLPTPK